MKHHFHVVCGPRGSGRTSLIPPRKTTAFLYYDAETETDHMGNPFPSTMFVQRISAMRLQSLQDRTSGKTPQDATVVVDNANRDVEGLAIHGGEWFCITVWVIFRKYRDIPERFLQNADRYYLFREQDVQRVLDTIPASRRGTDQIPLRTGKLQWWLISRWKRGRPRDGALGWTKLRCFEAPGFRVLRRCLRRRLWRKWIRELVIIGRNARRWKPRACFLRHRAYAPRGHHCLEAEKRWNAMIQL